MNFIDSLWAFYVVWGVMVGTGVNIALSIPLHTAIANWFVKKRGLAQGIQWVFSGLSGVLVLPLIAWLIATQGWRMTCFIGGVVMLCVGLPLVWFFIRQHRPEYYGLLPDGAIVEKAAADAGQMIDRGTPAYWLIIVSQAAHMLAGPAVNIHMIPFLTDIGVDPIKAAGMLAMMVGASIPLRLIGGIIADRLKKQHFRFILGGAYLLQAVGFIVFLLNQTIPMIYMPAGIAAPIYVGWVYDTTGSYISAFTIIAALLVFSAVVVCFVLPPKPPAEVGDISKIV